MIEPSKNTFSPDYVVSPGDILEEYLECYAYSMGAFCKLTTLPRDVVLGIIHGQLFITEDIAHKLCMVFPRPVDFWLDLEKQYQESLKRLL